MAAHEMKGNSHVLDELRAWFTRNKSTLVAIGYHLEFKESPPDRGKQSVSVIIASAKHIAQLVVWDTGEAELSMGDVSSGNVIEEHREITSEIGLRDATETLVAWVGSSEST
jgi:hypothetical protein